MLIFPANYRRPTGVLLLQVQQFSSAGLRALRGQITTLKQHRKTSQLHVSVAARLAGSRAPGQRLPGLQTPVEQQAVLTPATCVIVVIEKLSFIKQRASGRPQSSISTNVHCLMLKSGAETLLGAPVGTSTSCFKSLPTTCCKLQHCCCMPRPVASRLGHPDSKLMQQQTQHYQAANHRLA